MGLHGRCSDRHTFNSQDRPQDIPSGQDGQSSSMWQQYDFEDVHLHRKFLTHLGRVENQSFKLCNADGGR